MANTSEVQGNSSPPLLQPPRTVPLRIIRQPLSKPWRKPARPPPQVFSVHPCDFRQLVQNLTGAATLPCASEPMAEASSVLPTPPELSSAALKIPVLLPPPLLQPDSPALYPRPAVTANAMEHSDGGPAKYPDAAGGDGAEFLWESPFPANWDWSWSPIWRP